MTPTEQDKELLELQEFIKSCFGMEPKEDWYDSYRYDDRVRIRDFILADRKRVALEARIDELNSLPHRSVTALTSSVDQSVIYERIAELKQELEK